jgi:N4-gp56 family major capsid protein
MSDFTATITDAAVLDADELTVFSNYVHLAATTELVADQVATQRQVGNFKTTSFAKYANLSLPSALSDGVDPTSTALADSTADITPAEEGDVVTLAKLADIQSGLHANKAALRLVARSMGGTQDKRALTALEAATTNVIYPNAVTAVGGLTENDVLDKLFAGRLYNKLARANVPGINGSMYIGIASDDCLHDLRQDTASGGWVEVGKYADPSSVLMNEVGMFEGIRWLRSGNTTVTTDGGAGTVDSYEVQVVGDNALGFAASEEPHLVLSGPFDKLLRFVNIGHYGIYAYGLIDEANMVSGVCASSVGSNS